MSQPIKNNSQLLYLKARQMFEKAQRKFEDGTIKSEPKLIDSVFSAFQEFFTSMGKPNLIPRYAPEEGPPWSIDYNNMMDEIRKDLELLFQELDILGQALFTDFNHNMVQHEAIDQQYKEVLNKVRDLEIYSNMGEQNLEFGRDDFLSKNRIDYERISGHPLEIIDGAVTLPQVKRVNVAKNARISIIPGTREKNRFILGTESNGFPGNNTEIHSTTDEVLTNRNYTSTFIGEQNNRSNYGVVLDDNPHTWFEYEKVNVREHDRVRVAKNLGWDYQVHGNQTIQWAEDPDDGKLKLHMHVILEKEEVINQINCHMYTPPNYQAKAAVVKNILVADGSGVPKSVLKESHDPEQYHFHFPPTKAKTISIMFEQEHKYITDIGHIFYEKRMQAQDDAEYAMDEATKRYKYAPRVEGPLMTLEDLGINIKVSPSSVEADYPFLQATDQAETSIGHTLDRMMSKIDSSTVDMGVEKFEGFRWCIGVRNIEIFSCEYADEGELITHPFYFQQPIDKISLQVKENIPSIFAEHNEMKYDWLEYFVSIDDGATWYPITPLFHEVWTQDQPPKIYTIQTIESGEQRLKNKTAYIESEYPVYSLRLKIIGRRPQDTFASFANQDKSLSLTHSSPILQSYVFQATTTSPPFDSDESDLALIQASRIPEVDGPTPPSMGGPWDDDDGDGIPNWRDPDHPGYIPDPSDGEQTPLRVVIQNKRSSWCNDKPLLLNGYAQSSNNLKTLELIVNNEVKQTLQIQGQRFNFSLNLPKMDDVDTDVTIIVKVYDQTNMAMDAVITHILDCDTLPDDERPENKHPDTLSVTLENKINQICMCDTLNIVGTMQGPHPIHTMLLHINGVSIDYHNLGEPLNGDPCQDGFHSLENKVDVKVQQLAKKSDEELLEIEDFGEWLDAFEEKYDCGCKKKKRKNNTPSTFKPMAIIPHQIKTMSERSFNISIPYWKLDEIGIGPDSGPVTVEVTVYDDKNASANDRFQFIVEDCREEEFCYELESIEVHYFDERTKTIEQKIIPANALPFEYIENGAGTGIVVGWDQHFQAPVLMVAKGYDLSGYAFQIHAVGIHYLDGNQELQTKWASSVTGEGQVRHLNKMLGSPDKDASWVHEIKEYGDYSSAPSLGATNVYATFLMGSDWENNACEIYQNFEPTQYIQPVDPIEGPDDEMIYECNTLTHILFQVYDEAEKELKMYKIDMGENGKSTYELQTKNGPVTISVGWVAYFNSPAIQIQRATGDDNLLLTALGVLYLDRFGKAQTNWSEQLRYKTNGVQYPEFVIGTQKAKEEIYWIDNDMVNYEEATYIGKQGDMVAYLLERTFTDDMCTVTKTVDDEMGINPDTILDEPQINFINAPETICFEDESLNVNAIISDVIELKEVTYAIYVNGEYMYGPYTNEVHDSEYEVEFHLSPSQFEIGDTVRLHIRATNLFNVIVEKENEVMVESCDQEPPSITATIGLELIDGYYCYNDLINGNQIPLSLHITDDTSIYEWSFALDGQIIQMEEYSFDENMKDTGVMELLIPLHDIPNKEVEKRNTLTITAIDISGKESVEQIELSFIDCSAGYAEVSGNLTAETEVTYSIGGNIDLGDFMSEWVEWHHDQPGDWAIVENANRTELTNLINQNGYSLWYNPTHMNEADYQIEMSYQPRRGDDDTIGAIFRIQKDAQGNITGFYSVEHDGTNSWVNGSGFRIIKHSINGSVMEKTILAESAAHGWEINSRRAYKINIVIQGSEFTVNLYGDSVLTRSENEAPSDPIDWVHLTTLSAQDTSYQSGAWGPLTNSNPHTYFWDLRMVHINTITGVEDPQLRRIVPVDVKEEYDIEEMGSTKDLTLTTTSIGNMFHTAIDQTLANRGIDRSRVLNINYLITGSTLRDIQGNVIPVSDLSFDPSHASNPQSTSIYESIIKANTIVGR